MGIIFMILFSEGTFIVIYFFTNSMIYIILRLQLSSMIKRILTIYPQLSLSSSAITFRNRQTFILERLFKKRYNEREKMREQLLRKSRAKNQQTYSYQGNQNKGDEQQQGAEQTGYEDEPKYDFFSRKKQMELNKDYRKIKEESGFIPEEIGKGGFDEVVYWSQNAKSLEQITQIIKVFNRMPFPQKIQDQYKFQQFLINVIENVYLLNNFDNICQFCTFGWKINLKEDYFWEKVEEKVMRMNPSTPQEIRKCIDIAFMMSKCEKGETIYSKLKVLFKNIELEDEDMAKLLVVYFNCDEVQKQWVNDLLLKIQKRIQYFSRQILLEILPIFKEIKTLTDRLEQKIIQRIQQVVEFCSYRQLCKISYYIGNEKGSDKFWKQVQKNAQKQLSKKPLNTKAFLQTLTELLPSYKLSSSFLKKYIIPFVRENSCQVLYEISSMHLSQLSKILYIYEFEKQTQDIEEILQTIIMKRFNDLKNVTVEELICVIKDFTITRNGSRQIYIFFEEVVLAKLNQIKENKEHLDTLTVIYDKSKLCSPELLGKLQFYE